MTQSAGQGGAIWRAMTMANLPDVMAIAVAVHPDYPEDEAIFAERLALYPAGCLCLVDADGAAGYVLSHPWRPCDIPALNALLGAIPADAAAYYIHDLALLPHTHGTGAASDVVARLVEHARNSGFAGMALVAVNRSAGFWQRHGFRETHDAALDRKLASYDDAARYMTREF
ncbi:N-acetyltransferase [Bosea caraganae]|uniref:N-acetyltransferase n=1 Tax=Bosea caraganae TaxID=2763117 RepID=A0A370L3R3_9HYPH|nr:GNAT family N-acetyltransferase [Bosea caraganae]RDJ23084.1 N-acetyltransferase [Bosea caraganae]RDJ28864.1 N-acetyltransferase [Bosea caraganae]